jgi:hypothetical protein
LLGPPTLVGAGPAVCLYEEAEFPLREFVEQLTGWLAQSPEPANSVIYDSVESEEHGLLWVRRSGAGWRIGLRGVRVRVVPT